MSAWLEIQRLGLVDRRDLEPQGNVALAVGPCPGCAAEPFFVAGSDPQDIGAGITRSNGRAQCCGDPVGYLYSASDSLFGKEEDDAVLMHGRARVYGGGIRS